MRREVRTLKYLIPIFSLTALLTIIIVGARPARAEAAAGYPSIIQKLAEKFNLNQDEVKSVFNEERSQRFANRQKAFADGLGKAVADGVITDSQRQTLLEKHQQMRANHEDMRNWMQDTGIDFSKLHSYTGFASHHNGRMGMHW